MSESRDFFAVAVVGTMNPRLHHPKWYHAVGLLEEAEADAAIEDKNMVCMQSTAEFVTPSFRIACASDAWVIQTWETSHLKRILDIAKRTFDDKLSETRLSAFGFNMNYHRRTSCPDVAPYLASCLSDLPLGLSEDSPTSAMFEHRIVSDERQVSALVQPSLMEPGMVFVASNYHYPLAPEGQIEIGPRIDKRFSSDMDDSESRRDRVIAAINKRHSES